MNQTPPRAARVAASRGARRQRRLDVTGIEPRIYETSQSGAQRFALVLGPLDKRDAETLRWSVLDHGLEATLGVGSDFVGNPRRVR